jgi:hypothetical protein
MDAFEPPKELLNTGKNTVRYSEKAIQKARIELRKLEGRFIKNLAVTRVSFYALGVFGLLNGLGTYIILSRFFGYSHVIMIIVALQVLAAISFILAGLVMKRWPGYCVGTAWGLSLVTLLAAPLFYPVLWFSVWTYILPILQMLSLVFCTKFAFYYQRRKAYLCKVLDSVVIEPEP